MAQWAQLIALAIEIWIGAARPLHEQLEGAHETQGLPVPAWGREGKSRLEMAKNIALGVYAAICLCLSR